MLNVSPGFSDVAVFSSLEQEYGALRSGAALVDRSARLRMVFSGPRAADALAGLVTNDVLALKPGGGLYAAALTAKGKIIADLRVFARGDDFLVDVPGSAADGFAAMIRKFVNPRLARFADTSSSMRCIGVYGPRSPARLAATFSVSAGDLEALAPYQHLTVDGDVTPVSIAASPDLGVRGFDIFAGEPGAASLWSRLASAGAFPSGIAACEVARVEAGRPLCGTDMDENTLAQEANLDALGGISYTKGCYTGQETVARLHFRGHVNKSLRGIHCARFVPRGAQLFREGAEPCGDVRSSAESPRLGAIAIAMLKRGVDSGAQLIARWEGGESAALVRDLPFD